MPSNQCTGRHDSSLVPWSMVLVRGLRPNGVIVNTQRVPTICRAVAGIRTGELAAWI